MTGVLAPAAKLPRVVAEDIRDLQRWRHGTHSAGRLRLERLILAVLPWLLCAVGDSRSSGLDAGTITRRWRRGCSGAVASSLA